MQESIDQLLEFSDRWAARFKEQVTSICIVAAGLLLAVEFLLNEAALTARLHNIYPGFGHEDQGHLKLSWALGVSDADATVVVTAMLALAATINIALASDAMQYDENIGASVHASSIRWSDSVSFIAVMGAAIGAMVAGTRLGKPGLAFALLSIAALTICLASATRERQDARTSALLERARTVRSLNELEQARKSLPQRDSGRHAEHQSILRAMAFVLATTLFMTIAILCMVWVQSSFVAAASGVLNNFLAVTLLASGTSIPGGLMLWTTAKAWSGSASKRHFGAFLWNAASAILALGWVAFIFVAFRDSLGEDLLQATSLAFAPLLIPLLVIRRARRHGSWPMTHVQAKLERQTRQLAHGLNSETEAGL